MNEPTNDPAGASKVQQHLHTIARLLRDVRHLSPEAQELLAELVDELGQALASDTVPPAELNRLAEHVTQLLRAAEPGAERGVLGQIRNRLEQAAAALESRAPLLTGLTRRLIETLSEMGI
jgi:ABC-type transporter Mla subunit MlaD